MTIRPLRNPSEVPASGNDRAATTRVGLPAILAVFLLLEIVYAYRLPRVMDEFTGARYVYLTATSLPYRDFQPPKTVLSYYIEAPPLMLIHDHWNGITWIKIEIAVLWTAILCAAALILLREARPWAVLAALAMTAAMSTFAERATEVRPDAIAAIFGLASLLALIRKRPALAGLLCAASFCSTQKGIYFALAGGLALVATWIRDRTRDAFLDVVRYGIVATGAVALYFAFWILLTSPDVVFHRVLFDKDIRAAALVDLYAGMRQRFWTQTIVRNPIFYAAAAAGLVMLLPRWLHRTATAGIVVPYALVVIACCIWHRQPWPYFFVFLVPTLFVVIAVAFSELGWNRRLVTIAAAAAVLVGVSRLPITLTREMTDIQKANVDLGQQLLQRGDTYLDGTNMLYRHRQAGRDFTWIDATTLAAIAKWSSADVRSMISYADADHPKLVIWTYRIGGLPAIVRTYVSSRFVPLYGNILYYGPAIHAPRFYVAFDGDYAVSEAATIDGAPVASTVFLRRGMHLLSGVETARVRLLPPRGTAADVAFAPMTDLFSYIYDY